jgi:hypothetical protein
MVPLDQRIQTSLRWIPPWLMNIWIVAILVAFLIIRILGSGTGQRLLGYLRLHHS